MTNIRGQNFNPLNQMIEVLKKAVTATNQSSKEIDVAFKSIEKSLKEGD